jgi:hypothetical protein
MHSKIWLSKPHFETDDLDYFKTTMENLNGLALWAQI